MIPKFQTNAVAPTPDADFSQQPGLQGMRNTFWHSKIEPSTPWPSNQGRHSGHILIVLAVVNEDKGIDERRRSVSGTSANLNSHSKPQPDPQRQPPIPQEKAATPTQGHHCPAVVHSKTQTIHSIFEKEKRQMPKPLKEDVPPPTINFKTQTIHPIFSKRNWPRNTNHTLLHRPLWLASRLLESPAATHFFHLNFFGVNRAISPETNRRMPQEIHSDKGIPDLTTEDRVQVSRQLRSLARRVKFRVADLSEGSDGICSEYPAVKNGYEGLTSVIRLDRRLYEALRQPNQSTAQKDMPDFRVAVTLIHELAHAATALGPRPVEDFFEDALIAESGFELERRLFGMTTSFPPDWEGARWEAFPSRAVLERYEGCEERPQGLAYRGLEEIPRHGVRIAIGKGFVARLFTNEFWDVEVPRRGCMALMQGKVEDLCVVAAVRGKRSTQFPEVLTEAVRDSMGLPLLRRSGEYDKYTNPTYIPRRPTTVTRERIAEIAREKE